MYLGLGVIVSRVPTRYSTSGTLDTWYHPSHSSHTGLSPSAVPRSSGLLMSMLGRTQVQTPHLHSLSGWIRFVLFPFRSPLLRESQLLSFPADTKMFQSSAFPFADQCPRMPEGRKSNSDIPGSKPACGYPGHTAACHFLHRLSSQAIHHTASCCPVLVQDTRL